MGTVISQSSRDLQRLVSWELLEQGRHVQRCNGQFVEGIECQITATAILLVLQTTESSKDFSEVYIIENVIRQRIMDKVILG